SGTGPSSSTSCWFCRPTQPLPGGGWPFLLLRHPDSRIYTIIPDTTLSCLEQELASRHRRRLETRLRAAKFPQLKTLQEFEFDAIPQLPKAKVLQLAEANFVAAKENVICLGPSGTGKTHIATALGIAAIEAGYGVRFIRAITLAQELLAAQQEVRLNRYLKSWEKFDLIICDELGYLRLGPG